MKRILIPGLLLIATLSTGQELAFNTPVAQPSQAKWVITGLTFRVGPPAYAKLDIDVKASGNVVLSSFSIELPDSTHPGATVNALLVQLNTVVAGETGSQGVKDITRLHKFLNDNNYPPPATVVP